jgi:hypothetical protein
MPTTNENLTETFPQAAVIALEDLESLYVRSLNLHLEYSKPPCNRLAHATSHLSNYLRTASGSDFDAEWQKLPEFFEEVALASKRVES